MKKEKKEDFQSKLSKLKNHYESLTQKMTKRIINITLILAFVFLFIQRNVLGNDFKLNLTYLQGEKSRDSYTISTDISLDGNKVTYTKTSSGYISSKLKDENKSCIFTNARLDSIKNHIAGYKLNINDSLFDQSIKYKSYELFTNISLDLEIDGIITHLRINGDVSQFDKEPLYKNSIEFISYLLDMIDDC